MIAYVCRIIWSFGHYATYCEGVVLLDPKSVVYSKAVELGLMREIL